MGNVSSQSIILNFTKYSETSIIVNCYSLLNGYSSHIVKGVRSKKKSRFKLGHFQRLNLVEIENGNIKGNELSFLKNIKIIRIENKSEMVFFVDQTGFNLQKQAHNPSAIKKEINLKGKYLKIINDIYAEDFVNLGYSMLKK